MLKPSERIKKHQMKHWEPPTLSREQIKEPLTKLGILETDARFDAIMEKINNAVCWFAGGPSTDPTDSEELAHFKKIKRHFEKAIVLMTPSTNPGQEAEGECFAYLVGHNFSLIQTLVEADIPKEPFSEETQEAYEATWKTHDDKVKAAFDGLLYLNALTDKTIDVIRANITQNKDRPKNIGDAHINEFIAMLAGLYEECTGRAPTISRNAYEDGAPAGACLEFISAIWGETQSSMGSRSATTTKALGERLNEIIKKSRKTVMAKLA